MIVMVGFLTLLSCNNQKDLTFNEMVNQTQVVAKGIDETALFYESTSTKELNEVKSVFAGVDNTTIEVVCNSKGESVSKVIDSPFMEDEVIHLPVKLTLEEAEQILLDAGYGTGVEGESDWSVVVLRRPLEPWFNVAQYIFTTSKGYVSVNATTGKIEPVSLEGCPCPFKNPCICPEDILSVTDAWQANITINNKSGYDLVVGGVGAGNMTITKGTSDSWSSTDVNNTKSLIFGDNFMQGNLSFGPEAGVYVDRGWMKDQTISMTAVANGKSWTQTTNGGEMLLAWNEFEGGGNITLTFNKK